MKKQAPKGVNVQVWLPVDDPLYVKIQALEEQGHTRSEILRKSLEYTLADESVIGQPVNDNKWIVGTLARLLKALLPSIVTEAVRAELGGLSLSSERTKPADTPANINPFLAGFAAAVQKGKK